MWVDGESLSSYSWNAWTHRHIRSVLNPFVSLNKIFKFSPSEILCTEREPVYVSAVRQAPSNLDCLHNQITASSKSGPESSSRSWVSSVKVVVQKIDDLSGKPWHDGETGMCVGRVTRTEAEPCLCESPFLCCFWTNPRWRHYVQPPSPSLIQNCFYCCFTLFVVNICLRWQYMITKGSVELARAPVNNQEDMVLHLSLLNQ